MTQNPQQEECTECGHYIKAVGKVMPCVCPCHAPQQSVPPFAEIEKAIAAERARIREGVEKIKLDKGMARAVWATIKPTILDLLAPDKDEIKQ